MPDQYEEQKNNIFVLSVLTYFLRFVLRSIHKWQETERQSDR